MAGQSRFLGIVTQSGADTTTTVAVDTSITVDSKFGLQINALEVFFDNAEAVPAADWEVCVSVASITGATLFNSTQEIARLCWGVQNTAGVAVALPYEPVKTIILLEPRLTVQPFIYVTCKSTLTAQANIVYFRIYYEIVKLSEIETLRLAVGGL